MYCFLEKLEKYIHIYLPTYIHIIREFLINNILYYLTIYVWLIYQLLNCIYIYICYNISYLLYIDKFIVEN